MYTKTKKKTGNQDDKESNYQLQKWKPVHKITNLAQYNIKKKKTLQGSEWQMDFVSLHMV